MVFDGRAYVGKKNTVKKILKRQTKLYRLEYRTNTVFLFLLNLPIVLSIIEINLAWQLKKGVCVYNNSCY